MNIEREILIIYLIAGMIDDIKKRTTNIFLEKM
jgi:hypothetical protein